MKKVRLGIGLQVLAILVGFVAYVESTDATCPNCPANGISGTRCDAGRALADYRHTRIGNWANVCVTAQFECGGRLVRWIYYSALDDGTLVYFSVWRQMGPNKFILVGNNTVKANQIGRVMYDVPIKEQIEVQAGDFIGVYYENLKGPGVVPFGLPQDLVTVPITDFFDCLSFPASRGQIEEQMKSAGYLKSEVIVVKRIYDLVAKISPSNYDCASPGDGPVDQEWEKPDTAATICSDQMFMCAGNIIRWDFYSFVADNSVFYLGVWRKIGDNRYILVGGNKLLASQKGLNTVAIPPEEQIKASRGDVVGVYYERPDQNGVVPYKAPGPADTNKTNYFNCYVLPLYRNQIQKAMESISEVQFSSVRQKRMLNIRAYVKRMPDTVDCKPPPIIANADMIGEGLESGASRIYLCRAGYLLVGNSSITCDTSGLWTPDPPECRRMAASSCGPPPSVQFAINDYQGASFIGSKVTYTCFPSFAMIGDPKITCKENAVWSLPPLCTQIVRDCQAGTSAVDNPENHPDKRLVAFPSMKFECDGEIGQWEYFSRLDDATVVYFDVWRKVLVNMYELVGSNKVIARRVGKNVVDVAPEERIKVRAGDFIGIHYYTNIGDGVIPLFKYSDRDGLPSVTTSTSPGFLQKISNHKELSDEVERNFYVSFSSDDAADTRLPALVAFARKLTGCDSPPPPTLFGNYSVQSGVAFYVCAPRYMSADQSTATRCSGGSWPDPPACLPKTICQAGYPVTPDKPPFATSLFNLFTSMKFTCDGVVSSWEFYSRTKLPIRVFISVWEPLGTRKYRMTGYNVISITKAGKQIYEVPDGQQIPVYKDFVVGFAYDSLTNYEQQMVFSYYDQFDLGPYSTEDLFEGYTYPYTNQQLMAMQNGIIEFQNEPIPSWRIPALRGIVTTGLRIVDCGPAPRMANSQKAPAFGSANVDNTRQGAMWQYTCDSGYFLSGSDTISCLDTAHWSKPPICKLNCNAAPLINPSSALSWPVRSSFLNIFTDMQFRCAGRLLAWRYYALRKDVPVYLGVWDRMDESQGGTYRLIKATRIVPPLIGENIYNLDESDQIPVKQGYMVGIHYQNVDETPESAVVIPFATLNKPVELTDPQVLYNTFYVKVGQTDLAKNPVVRGKDGGTDKRLAAVTAVVDSSTMYDCLAGTNANISDAQASRSQMDSSLYLFTNLIFGCEMWIKRWEFFSLVDTGQSVFFDVWREVGTNQYALVGSNKVRLLDKGRVVYDVPYSAQIQAKPADFIGIHYSDVNVEGGIPVISNTSNVGGFYLYDYVAKKINENGIQTEIKAFFYLTVSATEVRGKGLPTVIAYGRAEKENSAYEDEFRAYWEL